MPPWEKYAAPPAAGPWSKYAAPALPEVNPAAGSRAAATDEDGYRYTAAPESTLEYLTGLAQKGAQGATFKWADELAAGLGAIGGKLPGGHGKSRQQILDEIRAKEDVFTEQNPKAAFTAEMGGALGAGAMGGAALASRVPALLPQLGGIARTALGTGVAAVPGGALTGIGALEGPAGVGEYATEAAKGAGIAGLAGGALGGAGATAARVVGPWATAAAQRLHDRGIRLTPGQLVGGSDGNMLGRGIGALEQGLTSVPGVNMLVRQQYNQGVDDLNREVLGEVLRPIGRMLAPNVRPGRQAIEATHQAISDEYDQVVPFLRANWAPHAVSVELDRIRSRVPQELQPRFNDAIARYIGRSADPLTGELAGRDVQNALAGLARDARGYATNPNSLPHDRDLGEALDDVREMLISNIEVHSPQDTWVAFRNTQRAFDRLVRAEAAASSTASKHGVFGPAQLQQAVRTSDRSARKNRFSRGTATLQNISDDAAGVMQRNLADSGSPERIGVMSALTYGPTAATMNPAMLAGPAALAAAYTSPAQWMARRVIAGSPRTRMALRRAMQRIAEFSAPGVGVGAANAWGQE